jgi:sugar lactone lactonase YvrE
MSDAQAGHVAAEPAGEKPKRSGLWKRIIGTLAIAVAILAGYLLLWPAPIDALPYTPPPREPLAGPLAPNDRLASAEHIAAGKVLGPEDVELDTAGHIFTGTVDGRIVRVDPDGSVTTIVNTGGRPVGIDTDRDGNLIVADAIKGLLSIAPDGKITTLVAAGGDVPLGFTDDVTVAGDGMIYFSDASDKFGHDQFLHDMLEARPHGRLLRYDPATKETKVLLDGLYFANGVALSQQEDFLLVNETYRFRIQRYWLKGERAGKSEVLVDNLPGFPDNITSNGQGTFWLAIFTVRNDDADWLSPRPFVKEVMSKLPQFLWPQPQPYAFVIKLDEQGNILDSFQDPTGQRLFAITSVVEHDGALYLGSLVNDRIGKYKLPE